MGRGSEKKTSGTFARQVQFWQTRILPPYSRQIPCKIVLTKLHKNGTNECAGDEQGKYELATEKTLLAVPETVIGRNSRSVRICSVQVWNFIKKRDLRCFLVNFAKFLRTPFL